jgi:3-oxoadipate CoA-transferase beta subunit
VDRVYTDVAVFVLTAGRVVVTETFGLSFEALRARLDVPLVRA